MTCTMTELQDLHKQKEQIWEALLRSEYASQEGKKLEERYISICRRIRRLELSR